MKYRILNALIVLYALTAGAVAIAAQEQDMGHDADIWSKAAIMTTYTLNRHLNPFDIDVDVSNGVATLRGTVESDVERDLAEQLALGVDGVKRVENRLKISPDAAQSMETDAFMNKVSDANITAKVKSQLLWNKNTHGLKIGVDTKNALVTLSGAVESDPEAQLAEQIARNTSGVRDVRNELIVGGRNAAGASGAADAIDHAGEEIADSWITAKVKSALLYNRNIGLGEIDVDTQNGIVHLSGDVDSDNDKRAAVNVVKDIRGVKDVSADLKVVPQTGS